ncbi:MAG: cysteine synthase family protein [Candidatus Nitrohelix vancouverensis]|uniref:Cysteine synthase family protein n=1 Tax=Candidatus Nitrohelix vancouverensis TaxID=2705534 RepID=A0A7T0G504_9BACT|nr:MAG: cysteine synthase family protein [Candidatus Nitrohelix vancouverensis]
MNASIPEEVQVPACPLITDESILKQIGNTPLLKMQNVGREYPDVEIYAKAEWRNAGGSVKSRPALQMILDGEKSGKLKPGKIILDSTSGNTGIAYALIGKLKGYKVKLVMAANVCKERKGLMADFYGAEIVQSSPFEGSDGAIRLAKKLNEENPELYFMPDQYNNDSNWKAHYFGTAEEIWKQTEGRVTHFTAGIGTGGTIMGNTRRLRELNPNIKCYAMEPAEELHGIEGLKHMASSIVPGIYKEEELDGKLSVATEDAYSMVETLEKEEGILVGHSSAAAIVGALQLAKEIKKGVIVTVFPDSCDRCYINFGKFKEYAENQPHSIPKADA